MFYRLSKRGSRWRPSRREEQSRMLKRSWLWSNEAEGFERALRKILSVGDLLKMHKGGDRTAVRPFYKLLNSTARMKVEN